MALRVVDVQQAVTLAEQAMDRLDNARLGAADGAGVNTHGGDPGLHRNASSLVRHAVNYALAAAAGAEVTVAGPVLDVGAGTGAFSGLLAERLGRQLHLVDPDRQHTGLARAAFPGLAIHDSLDHAPAGAVVTAMEVVEHLPPTAQVGFVAELARAVRPGGALVLSTPDESGYVGGWSGYGPHVGPLDAAGLRRVVEAGTSGWPQTVLRIDGPTFRLNALSAVLQPVGNRAWTAVSGLVDALEPTVAGLVHRFARNRQAVTAPPDDAFRVHAVDGTDGPSQGTGLLVVARRPAPPSDDAASPRTLD